MPQVSSQVFMSERKIRKLFGPRGNGQKTKCHQFFYLMSGFFYFCSPCFFHNTFTVDLNFVDNANTEICDYSLFIFQFRYIEKLT